MLTVKFQPFPVLETERLFLRQLNNDDVNEILELRGNAQTMKFIPRPLAKTTDDALAHIKIITDKIDNNEGINWAICKKDNPKFIGLIGLYQIHFENFRAEIGYMILPEYNNQGITSEAIRKIIDYGFDIMNLHSIEGVIDPANFASEKVLSKNGFVKEAHFIENEFAEGKFWDAAVYSLLKRNRLP